MRTNAEFRQTEVKNLRQQLRRLDDIIRAQNAHIQRVRLPCCVARLLLRWRPPYVR